MAYQTVETTIAGQKVSIETGRLAKQAGGAAVCRIGDTMVLATVCAGGAKEGTDFFPLTVEFIAKAYAAGKIPGGFFKREGKPTEKETLTARLIDRPIRPLFPAGFNREVQIIATVISADEKHDADIVGIIAVSAALSVSDLPFMGPIAAVRVGLLDGKPVIQPTLAETESGMLDMVVAGSADSIMMVEGGAWELPEDVILDAIALAHEEIKKIIAIQTELVQKVGVQRKEFVSPVRDEEVFNAVNELVKDRIHEISYNGHKKTRYDGIDALLAETKAALAEKFPGKEEVIASAFHDVESNDIRTTILNTGMRIGGRDCDTVRPISIELDILPRAHGTALFTRGETQALVVATLGTKLDEQRIDNLQGEYHKSYMLHYNFPPYSVGECKRIGNVGRREIGHGHLAERSLSPVLPSEKSFPYTIRLVSEILESNGSSSMASVCGGSLALMATGVPTKTHVAGVAMGLIKEGDRIAVLTDILGTEDHLGDMDFKVTGTREGITAIQMDIKIQGITQEIMRVALEKAKAARYHILGIMEAALPSPRKQISEYAPQFFTMKIDKEKIRELIGPGGKVVREIQESTQATVNISDDGTVNVFATGKAARDAAVARIKGIVIDPEVGDIFEGKVKTVTDFGAFVEFSPGKDGLVHISELDFKRVEKTDDICAVGDIMRVKLIGFDRFGKVKLSRKALLEQPAAPAAPSA